MFEVPHFKHKDEPDLWLYRYDKAVNMNKWDQTTKLNYVDNCLAKQGFMNTGQNFRWLGSGKFSDFKNQKIFS